MADHAGDEPRDPRMPGELFRATSGAAARPATPAAIDLAEALGGLDRATRNFTRRLGEGQAEVERARRAGEEVVREAGEAELGPTPAEAIAADPAPVVQEQPAFEPEQYEQAHQQSRAEALEQRMQEAELEARAYLDAAKRRADSLVQTMVGAVEHEAAQARREAEEAIRARWQQIDVDADRHVENARRVAAQMVAERQTRISKLSDGISGRAEALTAGMDDADRVRAQFDAFVRALAVTADQIAKEPVRGAAGHVRELRGRPQPSAMAA